MRPDTKQAVNALRDKLSARKARADGAWREFKAKTLAADIPLALAWQEVDSVAAPVGPGAGGQRER